jgi:hypothetical protein
MFCLVVVYSWSWWLFRHCGGDNGGGGVVKLWWQLWWWWCVVIRCCWFQWGLFEGVLAVVVVVG